MDFKTMFKDMPYDFHACRTCGKEERRGSPMKLCACKRLDATYCDDKCQKADWKNHKTQCEEARAALARAQAADSSSAVSEERFIVKAVDVTGGANTPFYPIDVEIPSDHDIFKGKGELSPISTLIGQPVLVYRHLRDNPDDYLDHPEREKLDNVSITKIMVDPISGFAAPRWQHGVGRVTVARKDKKPLGIFDLEKIWMYIDGIVEYFGNDKGPPLLVYDPVKYDKWVEKYEAEKSEQDRELEREVN